MVVMNTFGFSLLCKYFFPSIMKNSFAGYINLG
jgi:hypothetical protein